MVLAAPLMRRGGDEEVAGDDLGALVQQLEEGVLAVGAGLTPDDRPGRARHRLALQRHALAEALHVELLEMGGQPCEALVIGQDGVAGIGPDVAVQEAEGP